MQTASFQHCADTVIAFIDAARTSLQVAICWFTHPLVFQALQRAAARNVHVTLLLDYDHINFQPLGLDFPALEAAGATVLAYPGPGLLHHKFAVADSCQVLTGSFNWTRTNQRDHVAVVQDMGLAAQFSAAFEVLANACRPLNELSLIPPRALSFAQLYQPNLWSVHDLRKHVLAGAKTWLSVAKTNQEWERWLHGQRHRVMAKNMRRHWPCADILDEPAFLHWLEGTVMRPATRAALRRYGLRLRAGELLVAASPSGAFLGIGVVGGDVELLAEKPGELSRFVQWLESDELFPLKMPTTRAGVMRFGGSALELIAKIGHKK